MLYVPTLLLLLLAAPHSELTEEVLHEETLSAQSAGDENGKMVSHFERETLQEPTHKPLFHQAAQSRKLRPRIMGDAPQAMQAPMNPLINPDAAMFEVYDPQAFNNSSSGKQTGKRMETIVRQRSYIIPIPQIPTSGPSLFLGGYGNSVSNLSTSTHQLNIGEGEGHASTDENEEEEEEEVD